MLTSSWYAATFCSYAEAHLRCPFVTMQALDLYKPVVWEYARLSITNNVMSKRKLNKLVTQGIVHGWDDPRLLTLAGLRRRGVTAEVWPTWRSSKLLDVAILRNPDHDLCVGQGRACKACRRGHFFTLLYWACTC